MPLNDSEQRQLLTLARQALEAAVRGQGQPRLPQALAPALLEERGAFVTLTRRKMLRGCIGVMESPVSLAETVMRMSAAAALQDPRFQPLTAAEAGEVRLEVSALTPMRRVASAEEIVLGRDGVMVSWLGRSGVFLPQVALETGWNKERWLCELCLGKAGLPEYAWKNPDCQLYTFAAEVFHER